MAMAKDRVTRTVKWPGKVLTLKRTLSGRAIGKVEYVGCEGQTYTDVYFYPFNPNHPGKVISFSTLERR